MPEVAVYAPGTPSWVDLASPDMDASRAFYKRLFNWEAEVLPEPEAGGYTMFLREGRRVAGLTRMMSKDQPPAWSTYVTVEDANATTDAVREAGGQILVEPMEVMDAGRMAIFADPTGAVISVWQPGEHKGAEVVNQANSLCWNELSTRDIEKAKPFYRAVFGWEPVTSAGDMPYTEWKLGDRSIGGMIAITDLWPAGVPAHWLPYFAVEACDAVVATTEEQGGRVYMPATDIEPGRFAVLADPQGAAFAVLQMAG